MNERAMNERAMNEQLTFFCDRAADHRHLYAWAGADEAGECLYQVYCRAALDGAGPDPAGPGSDLDRLRRRLAAAGGGLIAQTSRDSDLTSPRVESVPGAGYDPATELLLLNPGQEPEPMPFRDRDIALIPGAFVLLPATRADQSTLLKFLDHLHRLPGDYRGLMFNVLRRPGIEATMGRLEQRLDLLDRRLTPAVALIGETKGPAAPIGGRWPWLLAGLLVLNLLGILATALWLKGSLGSAASRPVYHLELPLNLPPAPGIVNLPFTPAVGGLPTDRHQPNASTGQPTAGPSPDPKPDTK